MPTYIISTKDGEMSEDEMLDKQWELEKKILSYCKIKTFNADAAYPERGGPMLSHNFALGHVSVRFEKPHGSSCEVIISSSYHANDICDDFIEYDSSVIAMTFDSSKQTEDEFAKDAAAALDSDIAQTEIYDINA